MIVDLHTHVWHSADQLGPQISALLRERFAEPWDKREASPHVHEQAMTPVDVAVVLGFRSRLLGAEVPNELIASYVNAHPDRLIGFAGIDPMEDGYLQAIDQAVTMRMAGVTVSPSGQGFHPCHTRAMRLYEKCEQLGLPVFIHQGMPFTRGSKLEYARPFLLDDVARDFPKLRLIIAHAGHPWVDETLMLVAKHPNVFTELGSIATRTWQLYTLLLEAYQQDVTDHLLFGSDFPYNTPAQAIESIYSINRFTQGTGLPSIPREKLRAIVERDSLSLLGLRRGAHPTVSATRRESAPQTVKEDQG